MLFQHTIAENIFILSSYIKKLVKNQNNHPFNREKIHFPKKSKVFDFLWYKILSNQISHSQVKRKTVTGTLKTKIYQCYIRKKSKNVHKNVLSFSCPKDHAIQKLGSQVKRCALQLSDRQTDTKVETDDTLSGFQDFSNFPSTYHQGAIQFQRKKNHKSSDNINSFL